MRDRYSAIDGSDRLPREDRGTTTVPTRPRSCEQRLQHDVVLVAVGDQHQVDVIGQVVQVYRSLGLRCSC